MANPNPLAQVPNLPFTFTPGQDANTIIVTFLTRDPKAWTDFLKYLLEHPEVIMALLQLLAMLLGGLTPPPQQP